jgi:hypothetical protein
MQISSDITAHTIVLCVEKRERGIGMQTVLAKAGYKVVIALSLYDALKSVAQEMPHLVITEAILSDGSAGTLFDRLAQHATLKKTPIMVCVLKKTKEELAPLAQRKFAGFYLGQLEPKAFLGKVAEMVQTHAAVSPYFMPATEAGLATDMTIAIEANIVGRSGEQLVSRSMTEVDPAASMLCVPASPDLGPAVLRMATNLREGEDIFNLFPINRIVGVGRKWVLSLPEIKMGGQAAGKARVARVVFFDPNEQRLEGFREILSGYDIEVLPAKSLVGAAQILKREPDNISAVYLHELLNDASAVEWKNVYGKLPASKKPPLIVGTSSMSARSTSVVRYIKRPFGMGLFVEMLQACIDKPADVAAVAGKNASGRTAGVPVKYQAPANLVGIDEAGGIMAVRFPLLKGSKLMIQHPFLHSVWDGNNVVQVTASAPGAPGGTDTWYARFEAVLPGMSKVKYWEKISKQLQAQGVLPQAG